MRRLHAVPLVLGVLVGTILLTLSRVLASSDISGPTTISLTSTDTGLYIEHNGRRSFDEHRFREGDQRTIHSRLEDRKTGERVGYANSFCAETIRSQLHCSISFVFPGKGQVEAEGSVSLNKKINQLGVTGGTGIYRNVRGNVSAVAFPLLPDHWFTLYLTP